MDERTWIPDSTEAGIWYGDTIPLVADGHLFGALVALCDDERGVQVEVQVQDGTVTVPQMLALADALRAVAATPAPMG